MTRSMDLEALNLKHFGHARFRPGQATVIDHVMGGKPALVVMPTGHGKSLCYQLPAVLETTSWSHRSSR